MAVCKICKKRPGKRFCPALDFKICSICCATGRMIEIACKESCLFLHTAREQSADRRGDMLAKSEKARSKIPGGPTDYWFPILSTTHVAIVEMQRTKFKDLDDSEILAALVNARQNLETADTGLVYEHRSTSPRVQAVSEQIREALNKLTAEPLLRRLMPRSLVIETLVFETEVVEAQTIREDDPRSYLRDIALVYPWGEVEQESDDPGQLIVL
jgi:hypothetical protein